jgi:hypothetical protein
MPSAWRAWLLAAAVPLAICAAKLNLDLWYDEVYTLVAFVSKPWSQIVTDYSAPNNHIFYSLILKPFYLLSDSEFFLRLPSLLFTAGTLAMLFRLTLRWSGLAAAMMATLALGLTQMFLVHTIQVRGYGLSMFLATWLADLALPSPGIARWPRPVVISLVGALFLYTIPSNLLLLLPLGLVGVAWRCLLVRRAGSGRESQLGELRKGRTLPAALREAAAWGGACVLGVLLYLPVRVRDRRHGSHGRQSLLRRPPRLVPHAPARRCGLVCVGWPPLEEGYAGTAGHASARHCNLGTPVRVCELLGHSTFRAELLSDPAISRRRNRMAIGGLLADLDDAIATSVVRDRGWVLGDGDSHGCRGSRALDVSGPVDRVPPHPIRPRRILQLLCGQLSSR